MFCDKYLTMARLAFDSCFLWKTNVELRKWCRRMRRWRLNLRHWNSIRRYNTCLATPQMLLSLIHLFSKWLLPVLFSPIYQKRDLCLSQERKQSYCICYLVKDCSDLQLSPWEGKKMTAYNAELVCFFV
jgi:hypothetical protein